MFKVGDVAGVEHFHLEPARDRRVNRVVDASALNVPRLFQTGPVIFQKHGPGDGAGASVTLSLATRSGAQAEWAGCLASMAATSTEVSRKFIACNGGRR